ncbi:PREDICTED: profilin-3-like [Chaetura pelagica]|uniref:profilin-3-like n=1 Tax=Chaetura pelagica TaxID=8897 RepID=UPI000523EB07|nr:PREDICTED: profilin-3-like [Chaetura pelagica]
MDLSDKKSASVAKPGEFLTAMSPQEVDLDHRPGSENVPANGNHHSQPKCSVTSDNLLLDGHNMMGVRSKGSDSRSICVGKTSKALIFLMSNKEVYGGVLNKNARDMIVGM